jgi:spore germination cell wall hydrolase CwlJ-like protein
LRLEAVAQKALQGELDFTMTSTHYHATSVSPVWNQAWPLDGLVGDHLFYTCDGYC